MNTVSFAGKVMTSVFWDARGVHPIDFLLKGETINRAYYANLLQYLSDNIKKTMAAFNKK